MICLTDMWIELLRFLMKLGKISQEIHKMFQDVYKNKKLKCSPIQVEFMETTRMIQYQDHHLFCMFMNTLYAYYGLLVSMNHS